MTGISAVCAMRVEIERTTMPAGDSSWLTALVATAAWLAGSAAQAPQPAARVLTEVDYVVVGGGTAGCVLAARLCGGLPGTTLVLLERSARPVLKSRHAPCPLLLGSLN